MDPAMYWFFEDAPFLDDPREPEEEPDEEWLKELEKMHDE